MDKLYAQILAFNANRLPSMLPLKYEAMTENAFRYFRGTCHLYYQRLNELKLPKSPPTWICGDLHMENFGSYKANNSLIYFDLNDFDEAILGPAAWEIMRLISSIFVAFDSLGIANERAQKMSRLLVRTYSQTLINGKALAIDPRTAKGIVKQFLRHSEKRAYEQLLGKRTEGKGKKLMLSLQHERHFKLPKDLKWRLIEHFQTWLSLSSDAPYHYEVKDVVFRFAGTGSVGAKRYLFLLKSTHDKETWRLMDMKQAFPSSLSPYIKQRQPKWENEAERIVSVQKRMQYVSSSLLSTTIFEGESYVIQELQPMEDTFDYRLVKKNYRNLIQVIGDLALLTASSQLRSAGTDKSGTIDDLKIFGREIGKNEDFFVEMGQQLAAESKQNYKHFLKGYKAGFFKQKLKKNEKEKG